MTIIYRDNIEAHKWEPEVHADFTYIERERQWLLINQGQTKFAFLHCYAACVNHQDVSKGFLKWNKDLFTLIIQEATKLKREGFVILAMGDFNARVGRLPGMEGNTPDTNENYPLFMDFVEEVNLVIINTLPVSRGLFTRFMDHGGITVSKSVLDYGLIGADQTDFVSNFYIDENSRYRCGSDHALLECDIVFANRPKIKWNVSEIVQYNFSNKNKLQKYKLELEAQCTEISFKSFEQMTSDDMLVHLTNCLHNSAKAGLGLRVKRREKGVRLPQSVLGLIREKNQLVEELIQTTEGSPVKIMAIVDRIEKLKSKIKTSIGDYTLSKRNRTRTRLLRKDTSRRRFWNFLKQEAKSAGAITALRTDEQMVFDQERIEEEVLSHFTRVFKGSRTPVKEGDIDNAPVQAAINDIDDILHSKDSLVKTDAYESIVCAPFTKSELDSLLDGLPSGKSPGFDNISNELLKHSDCQFRDYLLTFLNQILQSGDVPKKLNIGKCMLVFKVSYTLDLVTWVGWTLRLGH